MKPTEKILSINLDEVITREFNLDTEQILNEIKIGELE